MDIKFKLNNDEANMLKLVLQNSKFKAYKDPKIVYLDALFKAVAVIAPK
jgi:hypothetical protein